MTTTTTPYDFDTPIERRSTGSAKWDWFGDALPLWVADMDFRSPEPILRALHERIEHGVFGYQMDSPRLRNILVERFQSRYGWTIDPKDIQFLPNLVSATNATIRAYAEPGDGVLIFTPAYPPFLSAPKNSGHESILPELVATKQGQILHYEIDFDVVEAAITPRTKVFLLCNPQNPTGRAWTRHELERLAEICLRHNLIICADEIHCDLLADGTQHIPFATLSPEVAARTITLMAPSKTFNIPTLHLGFAVAQNPELLARFQATTKEIVPSPGAIGFIAAEAAYAECQDWLDALLVYLEGNRNFLVHYVQEHFPQVSITRPEATYLAWMDWRAAGLPDSPFKFFLEQAKVAFADGLQFGQVGEGFVRVNYACPRSTLTEALERTRAAVANL
jgi:cysteine-S-conjugate beta-lyase